VKVTKQKEQCYSCKKSFVNKANHKCSYKPKNTIIMPTQSAVF